MSAAQKTKRSRRLDVPSTAAVSDKLDAVNMRLRRKPSPANALRRRLEANIDGQARKKRRQETSASSAISGALSGSRR